MELRESRVGEEGIKGGGVGEWRRRKEREEREKEGDGRQTWKGRI